MKTKLTQRQFKAHKASACGLCKPWKQSKTVRNIRHTQRVEPQRACSANRKASRPSNWPCPRRKETGGIGCGTSDYHLRHDVTAKRPLAEDRICKSGLRYASGHLFRTNADIRASRFAARSKPVKSWCAREDLNLQSLRNQILSLACLPFHHARILYFQALYATTVSAFFTLYPAIVSRRF